MPNVNVKLLASYINYPSYIKLSYPALFWNSLYMFCQEGITRCQEGVTGCQEYVIRYQECVTRCQEGFNRCQEGATGCQEYFLNNHLTTPIFSQKKLKVFFSDLVFSQQILNTRFKKHFFTNCWSVFEWSCFKPCFFLPLLDRFLYVSHVGKLYLTAIRLLHFFCFYFERQAMLY